MFSNKKLSNHKIEDDAYWIIVLLTIDMVTYWIVFKKNIKTVTY